MAIKEGIQNKGFSYIEIFSPCPTAFGRRNRMGDVKQLWRWYENNSMLIEEYERIQKYGTQEEKDFAEDKIKIGVLHQKEKPEYTEEYKKLIKKVMI